MKWDTVTDAVALGALMAITFSIGELVAIGTLLVMILGAVIGSYVGVIRRLDRQDSDRRIMGAELAADLKIVKDDSVRFEREIGGIRKKLHDLSGWMLGRFGQQPPSWSGEDTEK